jgi:hypothetical protein
MSYAKFLTKRNSSLYVNRRVHPAIELNQTNLDSGHNMYSSPKISQDASNIEQQGSSAVIPSPN